MNILYVHEGLFVSVMKKASSSYAYLSTYSTSKVTKCLQIRQSFIELQVVLIQKFLKILKHFQNVFTLYGGLVVFTMQTSTDMEA